MAPFICSNCGSEAIVKQVEEILRGGGNTAVVHVEAEVCQRCGERFYKPETIRKFQAIRDQLAREETAGLTPIGQSFEAV